MNECEPAIEEIPGNEVNVATRKKLANAIGVGDWGGIGHEIGLSLSIPDAMEEDCAAIIGYKDMLNT